MKLVELLALEFSKGGALAEHDPYDWPDDVVAKQSYSEVEFDGWEYDYTSPYSSSEWSATVGFDAEGKLKSVGEYEDGEEITREEYFEFIEANPKFVSELEAKRKANIGRIAELNKIAYDAVDEAIKLSHEAGLPYTCSMPASVADLDEMSDWDASRC